MDSLPIPLTFEPPPHSIPLGDLTQIVMHREKLRPEELGRCRREVLLQLAHSAPWSDSHHGAAASAMSPSARAL